MHKNQSILSFNTLRFRRWSRNRFAAFCSIGREVVIGKVKKSIADASLTKKPFLPSQSVCLKLINNEEYDPDEKELALTELLCIIFTTTGLTTISTEAVAHPYIRLYLIYNNYAPFIKRLNLFMKGAFFFHPQTFNL